VRNLTGKPCLNEITTIMASFDRFLLFIFQTVGRGDNEGRCSTDQGTINYNHIGNEFSVVCILYYDRLRICGLPEGGCSPPTGRGRDGYS
jgi:hypothetical protein